MTTTTQISDHQWSSAAVRETDRTDALQQAMSSAYRSIEITKRVSMGFVSTLQTRELDGLSLVECECDPFSGRRDKSAINHECPSFGIQIIQSGVERIRFGNDSIVARAGDVIAWRSDIPYEFDVLETLHKATLVVPWSEVAQRIPRATRFLGIRTTTHNGIGLLIAGLMQQMVQRIDDLREGANGTGVKGVFLAASAALLEGAANQDNQTLADMYLGQAQQYILKNLHDCELSVEKIALAQRISVRYLHKLFEKVDCSASVYITRLRLSRCNEALLDRHQRNLNVMEIASLWGYTDPSTFSKAFKREYGVSPAHHRASVSNNTQ